MINKLLNNSNYIEGKWGGFKNKKNLGMKIF